MSKKIEKRVEGKCVFPGLANVAFYLKSCHSRGTPILQVYIVYIHVHIRIHVHVYYNYTYYTNLFDCPGNVAFEKGS